MAAIMATWPTTELRGCRFHLGQSWWRRIQQTRIQQIGLACSYNDKNSDIAKWLLKFFRLSLLPANEIEDAFAEDIMDDAPSDAKCVEFADYVYNNYISSDCQFPPNVWACSPDGSVRTTNGAESFHSHLNEQFISPHPNIFVFVEILLRVQTGTYVIINSISKTRLERKSIEKAALLQSFYTNYRSGTLSRKDYIKSCSYRFAP